jgi:toxin ParE1/3/4
VRVVLSPQAIEDIDAVYAYIVQDDLTRADDLMAPSLDATQSLATFPGRGRPGQVEVTRELLVKRLPYTIVYTVRNDQVYVLGVYHQHQNR